MDSNPPPTTQREVDELAESSVRLLAHHLGPRFAIVLLVGDLEQKLKVTSVGNVDLQWQRLLLRAVDRSHDEGTATLVTIQAVRT